MALPLIFPFRVRAEITDDMSLPGLAVIYGDGHKQRRRNGLVVPKIVWNIECILNDKTDEFKLETFIRLVGHDTYFLWQSPRDAAPCLYYLTGRVGGSYRMGGGGKKDFFVRTMQFEDAGLKKYVEPLPLVVFISTIFLSPTGVTTETPSTIYLNY